jgi:uncharacterized phage-associated protein
VSKEFCKNLDWKLHHLDLHYVLYLAQMFSIGERGIKLFEDDIYAWNYGPIVPRVFNYFVRRISNRYPFIEADFPKRYFYHINDKDKEFIKDITSQLKNANPSILYSAATRKNGAWDMLNIPGYRDILISQKDMLNEYNDIWLSD